MGETQLYLQEEMYKESRVSLDWISVSREFGRET
jgi:hypothetical protein